MTARLALGDWRDVLPGTYDPARSVVVTDPPFGLRRRVSHRDDDGAQLLGFDDSAPWRDHVAALLELLPAARHVIRGSAPAIIRRDYPAPRRLCIEVARHRRTMFRPDVVDSTYQGWVVYGSLRIVRRGRAMPRDAVIIDLSRPDDGLPPGNGHRGITPYAAAAWAVETWAPPGWTVVDPFAGTGTIGRAALAAGCDYVGAEILPAWHSLATIALRHSEPSFGL